MMLSSKQMGCIVHDYSRFVKIAIFSQIETYKRLPAFCRFLFYFLTGKLLIIAKNAFGMVGEIVPEAFFRFCLIANACSSSQSRLVTGFFAEECRNQHSFSLNFIMAYDILYYVFLYASLKFNLHKNQTTNFIRFELLLRQDPHKLNSINIERRLLWN